MFTFTPNQRKEKSMADKEERILLVGTHAGDNPEKAAIPFVMGNAALALDVKVMVVLQGEGVYLAKKGYAENLLKPGGFDALTKLMSSFKELGGELRVCVPCIKARNIEESDLIDGAQTTAAGVLITESLKADAVFTY
jgi:predicted peroxiredoxin